jgi:hypothetical protein
MGCLGPTADLDQARHLIRDLSPLAAETVELLGAGTESAAFRVDGEWVVRFSPVSEAPQRRAFEHAQRRPREPCCCTPTPSPRRATGARLRQRLSSDAAVRCGPSCPAETAALEEQLSRPTRSLVVHGERVRRHGTDDRIDVEAIAGATRPRPALTERRR